MCALGIMTALALAAAPTGSAMAQTAPSATPSPHAMELARRMMKVTGVEQQVDNMIAAMLPAMAESPSVKSLPEPTRKLVLDTTREVMRDTYTPALIARMTPEYASAFSEKELEGIVAFYESPIGQAAIKRTPQLMQKSITIARELTPAAQAEVMRRVCEKIDCQGVRPKVS
jgi:uncharacterized protein